MTDDPRIDAAVAEWLDLRASTATPDLEQFLLRWPGLQDELRSLLSTMLELDALEPPVEPTAELRIGDQACDVLLLLGHGGMGEVHLGRRRDDGALVAIKVMGQGHAKVAERRSRFEREALLGQGLRHPGIVAVHGRGDWHGLPCLLLDFVAGIDLGELISELRQQPPTALHTTDLGALVRRGVEQQLGKSLAMEALGASDEPATPATPLGYYGQVARIVAELAEALQFAHDQGIVHRDVKPRNVLLDQRLHPHLLDFGLATAAGDLQLSQSGDQIGTVAYMSPEMVRHGATRVDHRTDVYSLGVTLFELLTLSLPFSGPSSPAVIRSIERDPTPWPRRRNPDVPEQLQAIALRALGKRPEHRYASAAALAQDLRRFLSFQRIEARTPGPLQRLGSIVARHRGLAAALTLLLLVVTLGPAANAWRKRQAFRAARAEGERCAQRGDDAGALRAFGKALDLQKDPVVLARFLQLAGVHTLRVVDLPATAVVRVVPADGRLAGEFTVAALAAGIALRAGEYSIEYDDPVAGPTSLRCELLRSDVTVRAPTPRPLAAITSDMVLVPGGRYPLGHEAGAAHAFSSVRDVELAPFHLDRHEVTNRAFAAFVALHPADAPPHWIAGKPAPGTEDLPVTNVTFDQACRYAEWVGKRLPTSAEWEAASRGRAGRAYAYGDGWQQGRAHVAPPLRLSADGTTVDRVFDTDSGPMAAATAGSDGSADRTPDGILHLTGNVREWVMDPFVPDDRLPNTAFPVLLRTVRGSSFLTADNPLETLAARRSAFPADQRAPDLGFRCAKTATSR